MELNFDHRSPMMGLKWGVTIGTSETVAGLPPPPPEEGIPQGQQPLFEMPVSLGGELYMRKRRFPMNQTSSRDDRRGDLQAFM